MRIVKNFVNKVKRMAIHIVRSIQGNIPLFLLTCCCGLLIIAGVVAGCIYHSNQLKKRAAMEALSQEKMEQEEKVETEEAFDLNALTSLVLDTASSGAISLQQEAPSDNGPIKVTLVGSSIQKDLKVKIQDSKKKNIKDQPFVISVKKDEKKAVATDYEDDDKDGIIHIKDIAAGTYVVSFKEIEGFTCPKNNIKVKVKDTISYSKVDVVDEIKKQSEVAPAEDGEKEKEVVVEAVIKDTVEVLDSTAVAKKIPAKDVDMSVFPKATATDTVTLGMPLVQDKVQCVVGEGAYSCSFQFVLEDETVLKTESLTKESCPEGVVFSYQDAPSYNFFLSGEAYSFVRATENQTANDENPNVEIKIVLKANNVDLHFMIPKNINLYVCEAPVSGSMLIKPEISDGLGVINKVAWSSSDEKIVRVQAEEGAGCTVSAVSDGSAKVTANVTLSGGQVKSVSMEVVVNKIPEDVLKKKVTDRNGKEVYKENECKNVVTVADYKYTQTYYNDIQYTGWQTINGKVYYYNKQHKPVTGTQTISGITYTFGSDGALKKGSSSVGIDVSSWQGNIDWKAVKASGIEFAIIRVGYRGSKSGVLVEDSCFKKNIQGATAAGIKVGVYFFTQAVTEAEAIEEASMVLSLTSQYKLSYPIFVDTENGSGEARANKLDKKTRTACVAAFCKTIQNAKKTAGIYASKNWYMEKLDTNQLSKYVIWVAQYNTVCNYKGNYSMWQYTSRGRVAGIKGNVDLNISYIN